MQNILAGNGIEKAFSQATPNNEGGRNRTNGFDMYLAFSSPA